MLLYEWGFVNFKRSSFSKYWVQSERPDWKEEDRELEDEWLQEATTFSRILVSVGYQNFESYLNFEVKRRNAGIILL